MDDRHRADDHLDDGAGQSGVMGVLKRAVAGSTIFMTEYNAEGTRAPSPSRRSCPARSARSRWVRARVPREPSRLPRRHRRRHPLHRVPEEARRGIFSGNGFILQRLAGSGVAWIGLSGELVEYQLQPGETIHVHPGHVGIFDAAVTFDIEVVHGIKNMLFGADSIFLVKMTRTGAGLAPDAAAAQPRPRARALPRARGRPEGGVDAPTRSSAACSGTRRLTQRRARRVNCRQCARSMSAARPSWP